MMDGFTGWPNHLATLYRQEGYWRGESVLSLLPAAFGDREAVVCGSQRWTYAELDLAARRLAAGLRHLGVRPGDRFVVQLPNVAEFLVATFALFHLRALPVFALPAHRASEITHLCSVSQAVGYVAPLVHARYDFTKLGAQVRAAVPTLKLAVHAELGGRSLFVDAESGQVLDAEPEPPASQIDASEVAFFLLSGGTTGLPKLIPRTHDDYVYNVRASAEVCGITEDDTYLAVLPIGHNFALGCPGVLGTLQAGGRVVMAGSGSPDEAFPLIARERVTLTAAVPPLATLWLEAAEQAAFDLSSLRLLQVGGAKFSRAPASRVKGILKCKLQQVFGMAEGLLNFTRLDDPDELVVETQGRPLCPHDEIRIVNELGQDVPRGQVGQLLTRGPYTLRGYYLASEHNLTAFTPDGYFYSGDLVRQLESGHLVVEGRIKDQINRGGDKIAAAEVEGHLLAHPNVLDAAVVAFADEVLGERTCAFVIPRGEAPKLGKLNAFLRERGLAAYKLPDRLEIVTAFPRTSVGKVSKRELSASIERPKHIGQAGDRI
jgi:2,3-dihydroxybenzoate-AMP ligase